jgi:hypothetical protein
MRVNTIFVIALLCSAALANNKADTCMYDQVSHMSAEGQKLAFKLTRTQITTTYTSSSEVVHEAPVISTETTFENHHSVHVGEYTYTTYTSTDEKWIATHGGWSKTCGVWKKRCAAQKKNKNCQSWRGRCSTHGYTWAWTTSTSSEEITTGGDKTIVVNGDGYRGEGSTTTVTEGNESNTTHTHTHTTGGKGGDKRDPVDPPKRDPVDPPKRDPVDPPKRDPVDPPKRDPVDPPKRDPVDPPKRDPVDPPKRDPVDPPKRDPVDPPKRDPVDPPKRDPVDPPKRDPVDPPKRDPVDPPKRDPVDPPKRDPVDPPKRDPVDPPKRDPVDPPKRDPETPAEPVTPKPDVVITDVKEGDKVPTPEEGQDEHVITDGNTTVETDGNDVNVVKNPVKTCTVYYENESTDFCTQRGKDGKCLHHNHVYAEKKCLKWDNIVRTIKVEAGYQVNTAVVEKIEREHEAPVKQLEKKLVWCNKRKEVIRIEKQAKCGCEDIALRVRTQRQKFVHWKIQFKHRRTTWSNRIVARNNKVKLIKMRGQVKVCAKKLKMIAQQK